MEATGVHAHTRKPGPRRLLADPVKISAVIDRAELDALNTYAEQRRVSLSTVIRQAIDDLLKKSSENR